MTGQTDQQPTHIRFCFRSSDSHRWTPVRIAMAANGVGDLRLRDVRWNAPSFPQITYEFALPSQPLSAEWRQAGHVSLRDSSLGRTLDIPSYF